MEIKNKTEPDFKYYELQGNSKIKQLLYFLERDKEGFSSSFLPNWERPPHTCLMAWRKMLGMKEPEAEAAD